MPRKIGIVLVLLMTLLQAFYAVYAYVDPAGFSVLRDTDLTSLADADWVRIYASRTLFIALVVGLLLYLRNLKALMYVAVFGAVMPITDAWLAFQAAAPMNVVVKHLATVVYLFVTSAVLMRIVRHADDLKTT